MHMVSMLFDLQQRGEGKKYWYRSRWGMRRPVFLRYSTTNVKRQVIINPAGGELSKSVTVMIGRSVDTGDWSILRGVRDDVHRIWPWAAIIIVNLRCGLWTRVDCWPCLHGELLCVMMQYTLRRDQNNLGVIVVLFSWHIHRSRCTHAGGRFNCADTAELCKI